MQTCWNNRLCLLGVLMLGLTLSGCATGKSGRKDMAQNAAVDKGEKVASIYAAETPQDPLLLQAVAHWQKRVDANPNDGQAQLNLGVLSRKLENFTVAQDALSAASRLLADSTIAMNEIGILQRTRGDFVQAEKTYQQILAQKPDFYDAHFNLGILYDLYLRRPIDAQTHYQAYLAVAPDADVRVEKWLADLIRRYKLDTGATAVMNNE